jgi:hypothetical protein
LIKLLENEGAGFPHQGMVDDIDMPLIQLANSADLT